MATAPPRPPDAAPASSLTTMLSGLPIAIQLLASAVGFFYTAGLLIVNIDLSRYGIVSLDLTRPEYVMAGAFYASATLPSLAVFIIILGRVAYFIRHRLWFRAVTGVPILCVLGGVLPGVLLTMFASLGSEFQHSELYSQLAEFSFASAIGTIALTLAWSITTRTSDVVRSRKGRRTEYAVGLHSISAMFWILMMFMALLSYALLVFPQLPREIGGGRKPVVEIGFVESRPELLRRLNLSMTDDGQWIGPVILVLDSSTSVAVVPVSSITKESWRSWRTIGLKSLRDPATILARTHIAVVRITRQ